MSKEHPTRQLLDGNGYIRLIETWGSDERIVEAARMSVDKGFLGWGGWTCNTCGAVDDTIKNRLGESKPVGACGHFGHTNKPGDEKLLRYLYENKHATPFEMAGAVIEVQAPIFVFREWHRHRTQSYNEMSARYIPLPDVNYIPTVERLMMNANGANKQAGTIKGAGVLDEVNAEYFRRKLAARYSELEGDYQKALADGVPKELARIILPVGRYSRMRASANLRNWLGFLTLRMDPAAQWEIRQYANEVYSILGKLFPRTITLFSEGLP